MMPRGNIMLTLAVLNTCSLTLKRSTGGDGNAGDKGNHKQLGLHDCNWASQKWAMNVSKADADETMKGS